MQLKKKQFIKLCASIKSSLFFCPEFSPFLVFCFIFALIFYLRFLIVLSFYYILIIFYFGSFAVLMSCYISVLAISIFLFLPYHIFIFCCRIITLLVPFFIFGLPLLFRFLSLRILKQFLSNEPLSYILISLPKLLYLFLALSIYNLEDNNGLNNLTNNNKYK